jgi:hypothetical protein
METQVRNYTEFFVLTVDPITRDEVEQRPLVAGDGLVPPIRPLPTTTPRPGWFVAVVAAVTVLVLGGGGALLLRATGSETTVATTPIDDPVPLIWSPVPHDAEVFGGSGNQEMLSVTAGGPGLVAVGLDGESSAAAWTSSDGVTWTRAPYVPHGETFSTGERMESVTLGGPGLVAVGTSVWTSVDGIAWTWRDAGLTSHDTSFSTGSDWQLMTSVTAGGPGLVAVGVNWGSGGGAVWTSVDGITWSRVPRDEAVFGAGITTSVTAGGPGLVAVGRVWSIPDEDTDAGVWTSVDGTTWSRVANDGLVFGGAGVQQMMAVTAGGPGLVAVGFEDLSFNGEGFTEDRTAAVWTSVDGILWSRVPHDEAIFGGHSETMTSVTATAAGLVAVGHSDMGSVSWSSVDGTTWFRVPFDDTAAASMAGMAGVAVGGHGLVAVGSTDSPDGGDAMVWIWDD